MTNGALAIKSRIAQWMSRLGLFKRLERLKMRERAFILMYHRVVSGKNRAQTYIQPGMYVTAQTFREHAHYLKTTFEVLSLDEMAERITGRRTISGCCAITFDDGWRDNFTVAFPILEDFKLPATIFLATGYVGTARAFWPDELCWHLHRIGSSAGRGDDPYLMRVAKEASLNAGRGDFFDRAVEAVKQWPPAERRALMAGLRKGSGIVESEGVMMSWSEAQMMQAGGLIDFGAHTSEHVILDQVPLENGVAQILDSRRMITRQLGVETKLFSYPNGNYTAGLKARLKDMGFKAAVTTKRGHVGAGSDLLALPRVGMHEDVSRTSALFQARILFDRF